jgi:hypothetical protein
MVELPKQLSYITEEKMDEMIEAFLSNPSASIDNNNNKNNSLEFKQTGKAKKKLKWNNPLELN